MQNSPAVFNKAAMMNIGFVEASRRFPAMDCVMFHDVDNMLENDRALMNCGKQPHHYATAMDEWNYRSPTDTQCHYDILIEQSCHSALLAVLFAVAKFGPAFSSSAFLHSSVYSRLVWLS